MVSLLADRGTAVTGRQGRRESNKGEPSSASASSASASSASSFNASSDASLTGLSMYVSFSCIW